MCPAASLAAGGRTRRRIDASGINNSQKRSDRPSTPKPQTSLSPLGGRSEKYECGPAGDYQGALPAEAETLTTRIIEILQEDGRTPYSSIATALGVSEGTVRNRVRQLIDDNVITIQAEALPGAFGYKFNAMTMMKVAPSADIRVVAERFAKIPEAYYLVNDARSVRSRRGNVPSIGGRLPPVPGNTLLRAQGRRDH